MRLRKVIREVLGGEGRAGVVNAVIAANAGERGERTTTSSRQTVVHRGGRTEIVTDEQHEGRPDGRPNSG